MDGGWGKVGNLWVDGGGGRIYGWMSGGFVGE